MWVRHMGLVWAPGSLKHVGSWLETAWDDGHGSRPCVGTCVCMQKSWDNFEGAQSVSWGVHAVPGKLAQGMMARACRDQPREEECRKVETSVHAACFVDLNGRRKTAWPAVLCMWLA